MRKSAARPPLPVPRGPPGNSRSGTRILKSHVEMVSVEKGPLFHPDRIAWTSVSAATPLSIDDRRRRFDPFLATVATGFWAFPPCLPQNLGTMDGDPRTGQERSEVVCACAPSPSPRDGDGTMDGDRLWLVPYRGVAARHRARRIGPGGGPPRPPPRGPRSRPCRRRSDTAGTWPTVR